VPDVRSVKDAQLPIDDMTSSRIQVLRFPLIAGIVLAHNYQAALPIPMANGSIGVTHSAFLVEFVIFYISQGVVRTAVPLFFLISGYLFFLGEWSWQRYARKLKRRFFTLFVPLLLWNLLTLALFALAQSIPQTKVYFAGTVWPPVRSFSLMDYLNALFGIAVPFPIAMQFWFVRDLLALSLLAPAIYFLMTRKVALLFVCALFCLWFFQLWPLLWPNVDAFFSFSLGAYLSIRARNVAYLDKFGPWIAAAFFGILIPYSAFFLGSTYFHKVAVVLGVPTLWWLSRLVVGVPALKSSLVRLSGASFFIFAAHEPLLIIVRKLVFRLLSPTSPASILALYFLIPFFIVLALLVLYRVLVKIMPSFLGLASGEYRRSEQQRA